MALQLNDNLAPVYITLGFIYSRTGKYEAAVKELERALKIEPLNSDAHRLIADAYIKLNKLSYAEETYRKAIELKPGYWDNYYRLGLFYLRTGSLDKAEKYLQKAVELSPLNYRLYRDLGTAYFLMERFQKAISAYSRSIDIEPNSASYSNLGVLYSDQKDYRKASKNFEKALELNNRQYVLWGNLAVCYSHLSDERHKSKLTFEKAIQLAEQKLKVNPNDARVMTSLADYYIRVGQSEKSGSLIRRALILSPNDIDMVFRASEIYAMLGDPKKALILLEEAVSRGYSIDRIKKSPALNSLHSNNRFKKLLLN